ncbi:hypothetical protein [Caminibacter sp.]
MSPNPKNIIKAILSNDKLTEDEKSEIVSELIEGINSEYPELKYHATKSDVKETELRLTKEIENTRKEIKELDVKLSREIKELDAKLTKEIENTRKEIKELDVKLTKEIETSKVTTIKWIVGMFIAQTSIIIGAILAFAKMFTGH